MYVVPGIHQEFLNDYDIVKDDKQYNNSNNKRLLQRDDKSDALKTQVGHVGNDKIRTVKINWGEDYFGEYGKKMKCALAGTELGKFLSP